MNMKHLVVVLALFACMAYAAQHPLTAYAPGNANLRVSNCDVIDGPTKYATSIYLENPLTQFMAVRLEYRDLPSGTWKSGTWANGATSCNVPAGQSLQCEASLIIAKGGNGNNTINEPLLHLTGTSEASPGETYETNISYSVTHFTGEREAMVFTRLTERRTEFAQLQALCTANADCCSQSTRNSIDSVDQLIARANASVSICGLRDAYEATVSAENFTDVAMAAINTCLANPPQHTPTPVATPQTNATATPIATQTPAATTTPTPSATPTPAPKSCPLGLALLFGGLGIAFIRK